MIKGLLLMIAVSYLTVQSEQQRIVCPTNICARTECAPVAEDTCKQNGKEFRPNSTYCKCCDQCIDYLDDGAKCGWGFFGSPWEGGPPYTEQHCRPNSTCVNNVCKS